MNLDVDSALLEVVAKDSRQIELETALKWASRCVACYHIYDTTGELIWLTRGDDYRHEALEHAAMVMDKGVTCGAIEREIERRSGRICE